MPLGSILPAIVILACGKALISPEASDETDGLGGPSKGASAWAARPGTLPG